MWRVGADLGFRLLLCMVPLSGLPSSGWSLLTSPWGLPPLLMAGAAPGSSVPSHREVCPHHELDHGRGHGPPPAVFQARPACGTAVFTLRTSSTPQLKLVSPALLETPPITDTHCRPAGLHVGGSLPSMCPPSPPARCYHTHWVSLPQGLHSRCPALTDHFCLNSHHCPLSGPSDSRLAPGRTPCHSAKLTVYFFLKHIEGAHNINHNIKGVMKSVKS